MVLSIEDTKTTSSSFFVENGSRNLMLVASRADASSSSSFMKKKKKKKKISSYGGDVLEELIVYEILPRLPIKSLVRFKLVSKKWHNFITHDTNTSKNLSRFYYYFGKREFVISSSDDQDQFNFSYPTNLVNRFLCIKGSTNGLVYGFCHFRSEIFICNPITKHEVVYIPNPKELSIIALACDPYNNPNFGFAIIAIVYDAEGDPNCYQFQVYSSKTREWRASNAA